MKKSIRVKTALAFLLIACLSLFSPLLAAKDSTLAAQLTLKQLKCSRLTENGHDEIYFQLIMIDKNGKYHPSRVPTRPTEHWVMSKSNCLLSNIPLIKQNLHPNETTTLTISLMESDMSSKLNPDDLIGAAKVTVTNVNNHIKTIWSVEDPKKTKTQKEKNHTIYNMTGSGGNYQLIFNVTPAK